MHDNALAILYQLRPFFLTMLDCAAAPAGITNRNLVAIVVTQGFTNCDTVVIVVIASYRRHRRSN